MANAKKVKAEENNKKVFVHTKGAPKQKNVRKRHDENEPDEQTKQTRKHLSLKNNKKTTKPFRKPLKEMIPQAPKCIKMKNITGRPPTRTIEVLCDDDNKDIGQIQDVQLKLSKESKDEKIETQDAVNANSYNVMKSSSCTLSISHRDECSQESSPGQSNDGGVDSNVAIEIELTNKTKKNEKNNEEEELTTRTIHKDVAVDLVLKNENDGELSPELKETSLLQEEEDDCLAKLDTKLELPVPVTDSLLTLSPTLVDYEKELQIAVPEPREKSIEKKLGLNVDKPKERDIK
ncbi:hypothetical protein CU098_013191 [Rhizopus stolonifer]|uniref:Uncharacterized protein n=1 Tax=Rhizopus stolonifer TaxID=4846 RepID=A0A367KVJ6_RHIST|nr:hypothetical protein CU098_013191 [Rhizopus stolonifer]